MTQCDPIRKTEDPVTVDKLDLFFSGIKLERVCARAARGCRFDAPYFGGEGAAACGKDFSREGGVSVSSLLRKN